MMGSSRFFVAQKFFGNLFGLQIQSFEGNHPKNYLGQIYVNFVLHKAKKYFI